MTFNDLMEAKPEQSEGGGNGLKLLFDLGHPAHYHLYKYVIKELRSRGDKILIVVRNREQMVADLLKEDGEDFVILGGNVKGLARKAMYMIRNDVKLLSIASKFDPDVFVSMSSLYSAHVSFLLHKPHISFTDTEISKIILFLLIPFTKPMITPTSFAGEYTFRKHVKVDSYKELAYLHPKYFKPDPNVLKEAGLEPGEKFVIVRFSAYDASHDVGLRGLNLESRQKLVRELSKLAKVFVTSEVDLGPALEKHALPIKPTRMHSLLNFASLYIGEGAVMASEAAILGIPSFFINPSRRGYLDEQENLGLVIHYIEPEKDLKDIIERAKNILSDDSIRQVWKKKRDEMLAKKTDLTEVLIDEIERVKKTVK